MTWFIHGSPPQRRGASSKERAMANLKSIDAAFHQAVESKAMPGIVAMAATDKGVVYEGAFGKRELGKDAPMTLDTVVWIASMTKAITASAAMQLVERGKLDLELPVSCPSPLWRTE
jgi:methyl acetate hydrolase